MKDYYKREIKLDDRVTMDHQPWSNGDGRVVGFTPQKVKVYSLSEDRILNIKPSNLTIMTCMRHDL
tara:strand:+ start:415 stop:612 length:198 start_codon:yes stop_codon:yes gene_type:complete